MKRLKCKSEHITILVRKYINMTKLLKNELDLLEFLFTTGERVEWIG